MKSGKRHLHTIAQVLIRSSLQAICEALGYRLDGHNVSVPTRLFPADGVGNGQEIAEVAGSGRTAASLDPEIASAVAAPALQHRLRLLSNGQFLSMDCHGSESQCNTPQANISDANPLTNPFNLDQIPGFQQDHHAIGFDLDQIMMSVQHTPFDLDLIT